MANSRFQKAILGQNADVPPIWFMRQAGRYHQHYQNLKLRHDFMTLCKTPELAAEVALGPIQDFDFDVSILFSDLLFPLQALGMHLTYDPGPKFLKHLKPDDLKRLKPIDEAIEELRFQADAVKITRELLPKDISLIGFVGGPWTLFSYAFGGSHDGNLIEAKTYLKFFDEFCDQLVPLLIKNIQLQLDAGAEVVMIFDTSAGELDSRIFNSKIAPQLNKILKSVKGSIGYYSKGTHWNHIEGLQNFGFAGFGFDHRWDLPSVLTKVKKGFVQGNFDQSLLFSSTDDFLKHLNDYLQRFKDLDPSLRQSWVCGLGHGVLPKTPEKHVRLFVDTVRKFFG